ncbi:MAG: flagellar biosynthesis repressor FlbT [Magnetospirillum sp. WYHS-4]
MDQDAKPVILMLDPGETGILGGMTVRNSGDSPIQLEVNGEGPVLRGKMMIAPDQATSPALRVYLAVQSMYLEPQSFPQTYKPFLDMARELVGQVPSTGVIMAEIGEYLAAGDFRCALEQCFDLLRYEALLEEKAMEGKKK